MTQCNLPHDEDPVERLQATLQYTFHSPDLLRLALTHSSRKNDLRFTNERLEFLGDAILGFVISEHLYQRLLDEDEGDLTRIKSSVVSRATLGRVAKGMDLGRYLVVAKGVARQSGAANPCVCNGRAAAETEPAAAGPSGRLPPSLLSDAFEAVIAAVYLDGGLDAARALIERSLAPEIARAEQTAHIHNYKSVLQHYAQRELNATPFYEVTSEEGPDHDKTFEVVTVISGRRYGMGRGMSKKTAEQEAAARTLEMLGARSPSLDAASPPAPSDA